MFTSNEGTLDRDLRLALGLLFTLLALFTPTGFWQLIPGALAVLMFVTAAVGFCPLYAMFGINTCKVDNKKAGR